MCRRLPIQSSRQRALNASPGNIVQTGMGTHNNGVTASDNNSGVCSDPRFYSTACVRRHESSRWTGWTAGRMVDGVQPSQYDSPMHLRGEHQRQVHHRRRNLALYYRSRQ